MIKITVYQNAKNEYVGFLTEGHAGYAPAGEDIVCAAVSMLVINTINSIEAFTQDEASVKADAERSITGFYILHRRKRHYCFPPWFWDFRIWQKMKSTENILI